MLSVLGFLSNHLLWMAFHSFRQDNWHTNQVLKYLWLDSFLKSKEPMGTIKDLTTSSMAANRVLDPVLAEIREQISSPIPGRMDYMVWKPSPNSGFSV